ncbi:MAG TPA: hypothetical protein VH413_19990 [Verrucomicrobiae bacterium]|jgi:hypothetical protein|nr:hypothetical protein [Verrucomicrobiae bacterium]
MWDNPRMITVKADNRRRVQLPGAKPGQVFVFESASEGHFTLTLVKPVEQPESRPAKVKFVKRGRYTVGESDVPVKIEAVKELLAEFP